MLKKYEEEVVLHGPIYVTWHNPFNFETIGFFKPNQSPNYTDEVEYENMADNYEILGNISFNHIINN
uniref:Uncharacterized protein n=1 Tax=Panagrolaimus sp. ES5 TaxID=591445 RepID=A0AC34F235_9BILA